MSIDVDLEALAEALERFRLGYLVTMAEDGRAHIAPVHSEVDGGSLVLSDAGSRTRANVLARPSIAMLWPPADPVGYSLIVDGEATLRGERIAVSPTRVVLHRAAPPVAKDEGTCTSDCVELPLFGGTGA